MYQMDKSQKQFMKEKSQAWKSTHYITHLHELLEHVRLVCGRKKWKYGLPLGLDWERGGKNFGQDGSIL